MINSKSQFFQFVVNYVNSLKIQSVPLTEKMEDNLIENGYLDSLDFINLVGAIEVEFDIEMELGDYNPEDFTTLSGLVKIIEASQKQNQVDENA